MPPRDGFPIGRVLLAVRRALGPAVEEALQASRADSDGGRRWTPGEVDEVVSALATGIRDVLVEALIRRDRLVVGREQGSGH